MKIIIKVLFNSIIIYYNKKNKNDTKKGENYDKKIETVLKNIKEKLHEKIWEL